MSLGRSVSWDSRIAKADISYTNPHQFNLKFTRGNPAIGVIGVTSVAVLSSRGSCAAHYFASIFYFWPRGTLRTYKLIIFNKILITFA